MLLLVIESATDTAAVALADEDGLLGSLVVARGRRHTETIAPAVEALCRRLGLSLGHLDILGVDIGPGLFTGLRVGIGTAQALAFALDLPVVTATSLEVLAHALAGSGPPDGRLLLPVVDARRGQVFSTAFRSSSGLAVPVPDLIPGSLWAPEALAAALGAQSEPLLLAGDGARRYAPLFGTLPGLTLAGPAFAAPPVAALAELCLLRARAGSAQPAASVLPLYLRPADATINWEQRIAPRATSQATTGAGA